MRKQHCAGYKHKVRWHPSLYKWPADHIVNFSLFGAFNLKMWFICCNILAPANLCTDFKWSSRSCRYELRHIWSTLLWFQANVRQYYQQFEEQQTQSLIDQKVKEHLGQTTAALAQQQVGGAVYSHLANTSLFLHQACFSGLLDYQLFDHLYCLRLRDLLQVSYLQSHVTLLSQIFYLNLFMQVNFIATTYTSYTITFSLLIIVTVSSLWLLQC